jgi:hypothetical protein
MIVRALVRSQAERQELLTRFPADHAAVRRVEVEIGDLELLARHSDQYLQTDGPADRPVFLPSSSAPPTAEDFLASFDESAAIELLRQSETYQTLSSKLLQAKKDLENIADTDRIASNVQRVVVCRPPEFVKSDLTRVRWPKLLTAATISLLLGFVLSRLGDSISLPTDFYSVEDVHRSLKIPVFGQLQMDSTPEVSRPERIASIRFWHLGVRLVELLAMLLIGAFALTLITHPSLWSELPSRPLMTYIRAFQELRSQIPLPYLFK